jgi:hypothetical protein
LYVHGKQFRIVYRLVTPRSIEIVEIWGIGKREKEEIYKKIGNKDQRTRSREDHQGDPHGLQDP